MTTGTITPKYSKEMQIAIEKRVEERTKEIDAWFEQSLKKLKGSKKKKLKALELYKTPYKKRSRAYRHWWRYHALRDHKSGCGFTLIAQRYGIATSTVKEFIERCQWYEDSGRNSTDNIMTYHLAGLTEAGLLEDKI